MRVVLTSISVMIVLCSTACMGSRDNRTGVRADGGQAASGGTDGDQGGAGAGSGGYSGGGTAGSQAGSSASGTGGGAGGGTEVRCASDNDCRSAGMLCDTALGRCVECLSDIDCDENQICENRECVSNTLCVNSLDCVGDPDGKTVCDTAFNRCVQCLGPNDCPENHDCLSRQCIPYLACGNSLDCPSDQVCDTARGRCVDCIAGTDCEPGQVCVNAMCKLFCDSDNDCTPMNMLCDFSGNFCANCLADEECPSGYDCIAGDCYLADVGGAGGSGGSGGSSGTSMYAECSATNLACPVNESCRSLSITPLLPGYPPLPGLPMSLITGVECAAATGEVGCWCAPACGVDADCPDPPSGSALKFCSAGFCRLRCDDPVLQQCPNGMRCVTLDGSSACDWN